MGGVQRVVKWTKYLPQYGWQPHILTVKPIRYYAYDETLLKEAAGSPIYRTGSFDPTRILAKLKKPDFTEKKRAVSQGSFWASGIRQFFIPDSKIGWYPFAWRKLVQLIRQVQPDAILSTSPPLTAHLLGMKAKVRFNLPWLADFRDYWLGGEFVYTPTGIHRFLHRKLAVRALQTADAVVSVSDPIQQSLLKIKASAAQKYFVIPNGFDPDDFEKVQPKNNSEKLFLYMGSLGGANDPGPFFRALGQLGQRNPAVLKNWKILFIGQPLAPQNLPAHVAEQVEFVPYVTHPAAIGYLKAAAALLFTLSANVNPGFVTGKIFEYIASGKPIFAISPAGVEATKILQEYNFGRVITDFNIDHISAELGSFLETDFGSASGKSIERLRSRYSRKKQTQKLASVLDRLEKTGQKSQNG